MVFKIWIWSLSLLLYSKLRFYLDFRYDQYRDIKSMRVVKPREKEYENKKITSSPMKSSLLQNIINIRYFHRSTCGHV